MSVRRQTAATAITALAIAGGCGPRAILELELELPAGGADTAFAVVQAQSASPVAFDAEWAGTDASTSIPLLEADPTAAVVSIVADDDQSVVRELGLRVRFCASSDCTEVGDDAAPKRELIFERALYPGSRTRYTLRIDTIPDALAAPVRVGRCDVRGCIEGSTSTYCSADGRHFCE
jgi:hypothetical protein